MKVVKRNGSLVEFDSDKIAKAIEKANNKVEDRFILHILPRELAREISNDIGPREQISVEEIQDLVEKKLYEVGASFELIKEYVTYRYRRSLERDKYNVLMGAVSKKLRASNVVNQNANVDEHSFGGRIGEAASVLTKSYALEYVMSDKARKAHEDNTIYSHDLDSLAVGMHNCLSVPIDYLLKHGFNTRQTDVRPAKSINTAFQLLAVLFQIQSLQQFGGVSSTHTDWTMVPYIRFSFFKHYVLNYLKETDEFVTLNILDMSSDELDDWIDKHKNYYLGKFGLTIQDFKFENENDPRFDKRLFKQAMFDTCIETKQAIEGMYHNLNTLQSRSGCQVPFTSINYGVCTLPEGRMCTKYLLETLIKGLGKLKKTSIFPCGIFQVKKGINKERGTTNYDLYRLALKATAQRLYPNYANCDWSVQVNAVKQDRELKAQIISELSKEQKQKIVSKIKETPVLGGLLGLEIINDQLSVIQEVNPLEEMGTMGK